MFRRNKTTLSKPFLSERKNKSEINQNRYLLKQFKEKEQFDPCSIFALGHHFYHLTSAQQLFLCFSIMAAFPMLVSASDDAMKNNNANHVNDLADSRILPAELSTHHNATVYPMIADGVSLSEVSSTSQVYKGLPASNITQQIIGCTEKHRGLGPKEVEMVCATNAKMYYLKSYKDDRLDYADIYSINKDRILLNLYNLAFLKKTLDVTVPEVHIVYVEETAYLAFERVQAFNNAKTNSHAFFEKGSYSSQNGGNKIFTDQLREKLHGKSYHQWLVARMFIGDITESYRHFGADSKGNLVVLDADISPSTTKEYIRQAYDLYCQHYSHPDSYMGVVLTREDVIEMKNLLESMRDRELPTVHPSVDMPRELYDRLIYNYISVCDYALFNSNRCSNRLDRIEREEQERMLRSLTLEEAFAHSLFLLQHYETLDEYRVNQCHSQSSDASQLETPFRFRL